jgi:hypothetical protein
MTNVCRLAGEAIVLRRVAPDEACRLLADLPRMQWPPFVSNRMATRPSGRPSACDRRTVSVRNPLVPNCDKYAEPIEENLLRLSYDSDRQKNRAG